MKRLLTLILVLTFTIPTLARNIDLSTVPARDTVQLTIYNAEDLTLVRETRVISFKQGNNPLQFSWANTLIDPTSVELRFLTRPDELTVVDTTFPHDKPQMLYWNVASEFSGVATVEIAYFTSGITWSADYTGITDPDNKTMRLEGFVTVTNNSGEDYEDAQVRLVVGTVNLVEKIAQLAQRGMMNVPAPAGYGGAVPGVRMDRARREVALKSMVADADASYFADAQEERQVIKEGLSEYFIFTIEGTETVPNGWAKRMRSFDAADAPVKVQYRYRANEYGDQLVRMMLLTNNEESSLGESPLPDGIVRLFRRNDTGSLSYLTQQSIKYIPVGDKIELNLGVDPNVVFEVVDLRTFRDNIWGSINAKIRRRFDDPGGVRIEDRGRVEGWDEHTIYAQRIRNYTGKPIELEIRRAFGGDATFVSRLDTKSHDFQTVQFTTRLDTGESRDLLYELVQRQGSNQKQNRVEIMKADPADVPWMN